MTVAEDDEREESTVVDKSDEAMRATKMAG